VRKVSRIKFHIIARLGTTIEEILSLIQIIKRDHPNAEISVEVEV